MNLQKSALPVDKHLSEPKKPSLPELNPLKEWELGHPVPTMGFLQVNPAAAMHTAPCRWPHPPPLSADTELTRKCAEAIFLRSAQYDVTKSGLN